MKIHWHEYGDTDMPVKEARDIYNEANARSDARAAYRALQNVLRNEGRLAAQYAPIYYAKLVADREARAIGQLQANGPSLDMVKTGEYDAYVEALGRGE